MMFAAAQPTEKPICGAPTWGGNSIRRAKPIASGPCDAVFVIADGLSTGRRAASRAEAAARLPRPAGRLGDRARRHRHPGAGRSRRRDRRAASGDSVRHADRRAARAQCRRTAWASISPTSRGPAAGTPSATASPTSTNDGLSIDAAADMLVWLMTEARHRKLTGVDLKDDRLIAQQIAPLRIAPSSQNIKVSDAGHCPAVETEQNAHIQIVTDVTEDAPQRGL